MILRELGMYRVQSRKNESINPTWLDILGPICLLISTGLVVYSFITNAFNLTGSFILLCGTTMIFITLSRVYGKFGVDIELIHHENTVMFESYAFSGDIEKDAVKVKSIIDKFSKEMELRNEKDLIKARELEEMIKIKTNKEKAVCNVYKSVMEKVVNVEENRGSKRM